MAFGKDFFQGISLPDIDKKKAARQAMELAGTTAEATGVVASWAADKMKKGAVIAAQGAKDLYQRGMDDHAKWKEIVRIDKLCREGEETRKKREEDFLQDFEKEREAYNDLIPTINDQLRAFRTYQELELLEERDGEMWAADKLEEGPDPMKDGGTSSASFFRQNPLLSGSLAGVSTGAGAVGLMTIFGSAGTGTALSSLTGAAYVKATLAALGGGPLYAGGAGMMGGAAVLGAAVLAPAAAVTGYLADKKINEEYLKAKEQEAEELRTQERAELVFQQYDKGVRQLRQLTMELYSFSGFFGELLNMSEVAKTIEHHRRFFDVLRHSAEVLQSFTAIRILRGESELNTDFAEEFEGLQREEGRCREELDAYRRAVDPERLELLDRYKLKALQVDALERELADAREKLKQIVADLDRRFHAFGEDTLSMLATGEFHFQQSDEIAQDMDLAGIVIEYGKSVERILTTILVHEGVDLNAIKEPWEKEPPFWKKINAFCEKPDRQTPPWVQKNLHSARRTRNSAAHQNVIRLDEVRRLRGLLFGAEPAPKESLLEFLHQQLC